nr:hypothetical protein B0A51_14124 [Rachicladosporium sp. CCFEE 5018]
MHFTHVTYAGLALAPSVLGQTLLASHYTGKIYTLAFSRNGNSGTLTSKSSVSGCGSMPSWLGLDSASGTLLCTDESGGNGRSAKVTTFSVGNDGTTTLSGQATTTGGDVHGSFYGGSDGKGFVVLSEYDPSTISTYKLPLTSSSTALQKIKFTQSKSGPVSSRQNAPHPHSAITGPMGNYLVVPDLGADLLRIFSINTTTGNLTTCPTASANAGDGPRHGAWWAPSASSLTGLRLYTVNELSNTVTAWTASYPNNSCLTLTKTQTLSTYPSGQAPPNSAQATNGLPAKAAEVHVSGNFVYVANRNDQTFGSQQDSIATYSINPSTGALTFIEITNAHAWYPRTFQINKAGTLVAVGGQTSSNVAIIARNTTSGRLGGLLTSLQVASTGGNGQENGLSAVIWDE